VFSPLCRPGPLISAKVAAGGSGCCYLGRPSLLPTEGGFLLPALLSYASGIATSGSRHCYLRRVKFTTRDLIYRA
jgi:hypothetical protein